MKIVTFRNHIARDLDQEVNDWLGQRLGQIIISQAIPTPVANVHGVTYIFTIIYQEDFDNAFQTIKDNEFRTN